MKLLASYDDREVAELAQQKLSGPNRLASERDAGETIFNLFGIPSWGNFYKLGLYGLIDLKLLLERRSGWSEDDHAAYLRIIVVVELVAKNNSLNIPKHWI